MSVHLRGMQHLMSTCYDFQQQETDLYEKRVEAEGIEGGPIIIQVRFRKKATGSLCAQSPLSVCRPAGSSLSLSSRDYLR